MKKMAQAYRMLLELVSAGVEFPTAHDRCCTRFNLSDGQAARLVEWYDEVQS